MQGATTASGRHLRRTSKSFPPTSRRAFGGRSPDGRHARVLEDEVEQTKESCARVKKATAHRARMNTELEGQRDALIDRCRVGQRDCMEREAALEALLAEVRAAADAGSREVCALEEEYARLGADGQRAIDELQAKVAAEAREVEVLEADLRARIDARCPPSVRREVKYHKDVVKALRLVADAEDAEIRRLEALRIELEAEEAAVDAEREELSAAHGRMLHPRGTGCCGPLVGGPGDACPPGIAAQLERRGGGGEGDKENAAGADAASTSEGVRPGASDGRRKVVASSPRPSGLSTRSSRSDGSCCSAGGREERRPFRALPPHRPIKPFVPRRSDKPPTAARLPKPIFWTDYRSFYRETEFHPWLREVREAKAAAELRNARKAQAVEEERLRREKQKARFRARPMPNFGEETDRKREGGSTARSSGSREGKK
ncbi:unnamed protein product [Ostreobium quekettii]|uniref:Uncharacterized protein n=1 Tax=Ostreobium quekettii TaxID=121088 RepID=A0A8S1J2K5_9CHLO|nr:unnamed protein product [Ostreobium quekettii]